MTIDEVEKDLECHRCKSNPCDVLRRIQGFLKRRKKKKNYAFVHIEGNATESGGYPKVEGYQSKYAGSGYPKVEGYQSKYAGKGYKVIGWTDDRFLLKNGTSVMWVKKNDT